MKTVGITVGDPAGIGPEIVGRALATLTAAEPRAQTSFMLFGPAPIIGQIVSGLFDAGRILPVVTSPDVREVHAGRYTTASGSASLAALTAATDCLVDGSIGALATGPICKQAFADAGLPFPGQTEFVASRFGCTEWAMMLCGSRLKVALATTHVSIRELPDAITADLVLRKLRVCDRFMKSHMGLKNPSIAVAGLNPHCGDGGMFGREDIEIIAPAIQTARNEGISATGPLAADTVFHRALSGEFDVVLAMFHDQGLGPLKLIHFSDAINITMGLERVRCACDHGPAFDLAGSGRADPSSMLAAIRFATRAAAGATPGRNRA